MNCTIFIVGILLIFGILNGAASAKEQTSVQPLGRIAFGSCNKHDLPQPAWNAVINTKPELWVWLGDVIYGDHMYFPSFFKPSPINEMKQKFATQKQNPGYHRLTETCPIIGIWDDHDFGINNGGKEYEDKIASQQLFLDFIGEAEDSQRRNRSGLYASYNYGPAGKKIKFILLDTRYHRDYIGSNGDMLGEEQWRWLEDELKTSDAQLNFIASGIQVLPIDKPLQEKWASFSHSRSRLFNLINKYKVPGVILMSGDVHYAEIFKSDTVAYYPIYEITSSGMTHSCATQIPFGFCRPALDRYFRSSYQIADFYEFLNFGTIEIHWEADQPYLELQIRDVNGTIVRLTKVYFSELIPSDEHPPKAEPSIPFHLTISAEWYRNIVLTLIGFGLFSLARFIVRKLQGKGNKQSGNKSTTKKRSKSKKK